MCALSNFTIPSMRIEDWPLPTKYSKLQAVETSDSVWVDKHLMLNNFTKGSEEHVCFSFLNLYIRKFDVKIGLDESPFDSMLLLYFKLVFLYKAGESLYPIVIYISSGQLNLPSNLSIFLNLKCSWVSGMHWNLRTVFLMLQK